VRVSDAGGPVARLTDDEPAARRALRSCDATAGLADGELLPIEGGLSNRAWRLDARGQSYFVRIGHPDAARLGVDRVSECRVLHAVAAAGLAPAVVACEPSLDLLVTRYVDAAPWQAPDVALPGNLRRAADCLRRLHGTTLPDGVHTVDYSCQARSLESELPPGDGLAQDLRARAAQAFARLQDRPVAWTLCHHDLHHLNVLDDGARLWLVDWEYGGRGDPLMDIAGFVAMHELGAAATAEFIAAYDRLGSAERARLDDARWAFDYVQWLWYRLRFAGNPREGGAHAERLAQRLLRCNNERLKQADG
jgi:thiamine kinase-like enzyme